MNIKRTMIPLLTVRSGLKLEIMTSLVICEDAHAKRLDWLTNNFPLRSQDSSRKCHEKRNISGGSHDFQKCCDYSFLLSHGKLHVLCTLNFEATQNMPIVDSPCFNIGTDPFLFHSSL